MVYAFVQAIRDCVLKHMWNQAGLHTVAFDVMTRKLRPNNISFWLAKASQSQACRKYGDLFFFREPGLQVVTETLPFKRCPHWFKCWHYENNIPTTPYWVGPVLVWIMASTNLVSEDRSRLHSMYKVLRVMISSQKIGERPHYANVIFILICRDAFRRVPSSVYNKITM